MTIHESHSLSGRSMVPTMLLGLLLSLSVFSASALRGADLFRADQEHAQQVFQKRDNTTGKISKSLITNEGLTYAGGTVGTKPDVEGKIDDDDDPFGHIKVTCPEGYYFADQDWEHYHPPGYHESPQIDENMPEADFPPDEDLPVGDFPPEHDLPVGDFPPEDDLPVGDFPYMSPPPLDGGFPDSDMSPSYQATPYENDNPPPPLDQSPPFGAAPPYMFDFPPGFTLESDMAGEPLTPGYQEKYPPGYQYPQGHPGEKDWDTYPPYAYPPYSEDWKEQLKEISDSVCQACPVGFTSLKGSVGSAACERCPEGYSTIGGGQCLEERVVQFHETPVDEKTQREVLFRFFGLDFSSFMAESATYIQEFNDTITMKVLAGSIATSSRLAQWYPGSLVTVNRLSYPEGTSVEAMDGDAGALVWNAGSVLSGLERFGVTGVEASQVMPAPQSPMMPAPPPTFFGGVPSYKRGYPPEDRYVYSGYVSPSEDDSKKALIIGLAAGIGGGILFIGLIVVVVIISRRRSVVGPHVGPHDRIKNGNPVHTSLKTGRTDSLPYGITIL